MKFVVREPVSGHECCSAKHLSQTEIRSTRLRETRRRRRS